MAAYISWFNRVRVGMNRKGVAFNGKIHTGDPIQNTHNKAYKKATCSKCNSENGFLYQSRIDTNLQLCFCQHCGKFGLPKVKETASK